MPHDAGEALVIDDNFVLEPTLPAEAESKTPVAHETNVAVAQRGQAVTAVCPCVLVVAHADARGVEEAHDRGQHAFAGHACAREVATQAPAQARQRSAECLHAFELRPVAHHAPLRMIAVLLAATGVAPGCLNVSARIAANPHVFVGGWNCQGANALERCVVGDGSSVVADIAESRAVAHASNPAVRIAYVHEAGGLCHLCRVRGVVGEGGQAHDFNVDDDDCGCAPPRAPPVGVAIGCRPEDYAVGRCRYCKSPLAYWAEIRYRGIISRCRSNNIAASATSVSRPSRVAVVPRKDELIRWPT